MVEFKFDTQLLIEGQNLNEDQIKMCIRDRYNVDGLTGLKNRASLEYDYMNFYIKDKVLSVIMIDLDRLKKVNDNYGHSYGDEYIRLATEAIKKAVGKLGISYRLGGDEFVVIMNCVNKMCIRDSF